MSAARWSLTPSGTLLREHLSRLEATGRLVRIDRQVDPVHELAGVAWKLRHAAVVFEHVAGHRLPVVANLCPSRVWLAEAMGVPADEVAARFLEGVERPLGCRVLAHSPYQPVVGRDIDLPALLPITRDHDRQVAPVINGGVMIARDPATGLLNTSFHILELRSKDEFVVHVVAQDFGRIWGWHRRRGEPLPVALLLGLDPVLWTASALVMDHPPSELEVAGAVRGRPVELAPGHAVDLPIPADAEIVLEGEILPDRMEPLGPEPRPSGYYGPAKRGPVFRVRCVSMRPDPAFHVLVSGSRDHQLLLAVSKEVTVTRWLRKVAPFVSRVSCYGSTCAMAVRRDGVPRVPELLEAVMRYRTLDRGAFKFVIALDEDVDVFDREEVENALYTRLRPDRVMVLSARGSAGDPSATAEGVRKFGVDATVPEGERERYHRPHIPGMSRLTVRDYLPVPLPVADAGHGNGEGA